MKENKMGTMSVSRLIISMSLPMMLSMLVQALYNVVDSIFVAQISENAFTAVSLAFPVQNLIASVGCGTAIGVNALLSKYLGQRLADKASSSARNGIFLAFLSFVVFAVLGIFFTELYFKVQTADSEIIGFGNDYLSICLIFSMGAFMQMMLERLLLSTGKTVLAMSSQLIGSVVNIILDPVLIFGWFGFPVMGVVGAAIATVAGQHVAALAALIMNIKCNGEISVSFKNFKPDLKMIKKIYSVGVPSVIMMSIGSVTTFLMNKILLGFTSTAAAVFGAYFKLQSFIFMPIFGMNSGMVPIIAYNYGAKNAARIIKTVKLCVLYAVVIMLVGIIIMWVFPDKLLMMFNPSDDMLAMGIKAMRIISLSFTFAGYCIICGSAFQALGNGVLSMIVSIVRQLVVLVPVAYMLSLTGNVNNVWWSYPIAELASVTVSTAFLIWIYNKKVKVIKGCDESV